MVMCMLLLLAMGPVADSIKMNEGMNEMICLCSIGAIEVCAKHAGFRHCTGIVNRTGASTYRFKGKQNDEKVVLQYTGGGGQVCHRFRIRFTFVILTLFIIALHSFYYLLFLVTCFTVR